MSTENSKFLHGGLARILFALLAIILAVFAWFQYQKISQIKISQEEITSSGQLAAFSSNPALEKCKDQIFASIDQRVKDGFLDAEKVKEEKANAVSLCISNVRSGTYN